MATAAQRVFGTVELLEQIIFALPLNSMLRSRRVSRLFRDVIDESEHLLRIRANPIIGVHLRVPAQCSLSALRSQTLDADLILSFDQPLTVRTSTRLSQGSKGLIYGLEMDCTPPEPPSRPTYDLGLSRALRPCRETESKYLTLLPGISHQISWPLASFSGMSDQYVHQGMLSEADVGKTYVLRVWPDITLTSYVGDKRTLLAKVDAGQDIGWGKEIALIGKNEAMFTVVP